MSVLHPDDLAPQLFECFMDRAQANMPKFFPSDAKGALVAGPDLLRELEDFPESYESWGYQRSTDGNAYERASPKVDGYLEVERWGEFWYILRTIKENKDPEQFQVLVLAFENVPICTRTFEDAIRLAEHCHPVARAPMAGYWFTYHHA